MPSLLLSLVFSIGMAQASTKVQVNANTEPDVCGHFRKALQEDHVAAMTSDQLCQYSFVQKHANQGYFQRLTWQKVPGNPVALTMKIYDANELPSDIKPATGTKKKRADALAYAKIQAQHHALFIEVAPFSFTEMILPATFKQLHGYILRSRGEYCGPGSSYISKRNGLVAIYFDKSRTKPLGILSGNNVYGYIIEPVKINGKYYFIDNWYGAKNGGAHFMGVSTLLFSSDQKQIFKTSVCDFTYIKGGK